MSTTIELSSNRIPAWPSDEECRRLGLRTASEIERSEELRKARRRKPRAKTPAERVRARRKKAGFKH